MNDHGEVVICKHDHGLAKIKKSGDVSYQQLTKFIVSELFKIEIIEGSDTSSYFWFRPAIVKETERITWDEVTYLDEVFSIEEDDILDFLSYFFEKYFDNELIFNKNRVEDNDEHIIGFEWYLTDNFYTYDTLLKMTEEINAVADLLVTDYHNPCLNDVKKMLFHCSVVYINESDEIVGIDCNESTITYFIPSIVDFYHRFTQRIKKMMENNKSTNIISIIGP